MLMLIKRCCLRLGTPPPPADFAPRPPVSLRPTCQHPLPLDPPLPQLDTRGILSEN
ncbi:hypothetical protein P154DRAFT_42261 [Amniculicola lignicola CBS 123094]|uniref:Uncharacterized protein n=1 Tax=Amniculicola lignicola CBS 123094 TaxID=1392246 RepID=A0A6A5WRS5_9PLEO|nr:hypothetical protein P154DRAFT_42261 [Amniculicola lignicola CBS 123094]